MHDNDHLSRKSGLPQFEPDLSTAVLRIVGVVAVSFWLASYLPAALMPLAMSQFLGVGALVSATVAFFLREVPHAPRATRWDEAAVLFAASLVMDGFVDPETAGAALNSLSGPLAAAAEGATK